jgi:cytosine/adenosine deaminase-related metal-dependent hydrolase
MGSAILLKRGTLLIPDDAQPRFVRPVQADLLVVDDRIARISPNIELPGDLAATYQVTTVDCHRKIVTPGFIDTHHHLWQTQLRGRHGDHTVLDYMPTGNLAASFFTPSDVFWGQLGGALEAIDSGTTTVVDHAHMNYSEQHCK